MKTTIFLVTLFILVGTTIYGQNAENKWGVGLHLGVMEYNGDYGNEFYRFDQGYAVGASLARYLNPSFDIVGHFFYDKVRANDGGKKTGSIWYDFATHMFNMNILAKYKFNNGYIFKEDARLAPYILGGIGGNFANSSGTGPLDVSGNVNPFTNTYFNPNLYGGLGVNLRILPAVSLAVQSSLMVPFTDKLDGYFVNTAGNKSGDMFLENSVAVFISPGKGSRKDSDGDGVSDKKDLCPDTPPGVAVDENGCPLDKDGDGVPDYKDECPDVAGLEKFNGCPDTDGDGIPDKNDECPDVPGTALLKGCPDADGDGVADKDDRCPNTPKGYKVDRFGCPVDSDRDGIPDSEDACPDKPGVAELKGCPYTVQFLMSKYALENKVILFDFDSYKLRPDGITTLEQIYQVLNNHRDFGVEFFGHTDNVGPEDYNMKLSDKRAFVAKDYLLKKGVEGTRILTEYYGEAKPADSNATKAGRQLNRRTEFKLFEVQK